MAVKIRQVWHGIEGEVTNTWERDVAVNITVESGTRYKEPGWIQGASQYRDRYVDLRNFPMKTGQKQNCYSYPEWWPLGQPLGVGSLVWIRVTDTNTGEALEYSGPISYQAFVVPTEVMGVGIGAVIGGVAGYLLKEPLGPIVSEVVGAVLGGALGGGVGLLTGLGIIPVPQIPSLEAAPEGPGAPARLGKYQITG